MASSVNGEYQLDTINEVHTNTQDNTQEEGPRWIPGEVTTSTSTVEYQEGAWAIGWPSSVNEERVIQDDLILKYNFQDWGAPVPPVPPTPTGLVLNFSVENWSTQQPWGWTLNITMLDDVPEWASLITYATCCTSALNCLTVISQYPDYYDKQIIVSPEEWLDTLAWCYCRAWGSWQDLQHDVSVEASNWMAIKAIVYSNS